MKVTIESTTKIVEVKNEETSQWVPARIWEGVTESGIQVRVFVTRITAPRTADLTQFEAELHECREPSPDVKVWPLHMIL